MSSARTRIRFATEGVLTRRLLSDPSLRGVGAVVLDEFHERSVQSDVALAMLAELRRSSRPDLRLVVMSATLDGARVADFLGGASGPAPRVRSEGRRFDVVIEHLPRADDRPLEQLVAAAVDGLVTEGLDGDVLVFLPGAREIRRAASACANVAARADLMVVALHGDLPPAEQDRAVAPASRRKVILSTNVAETSVTIDGVVAVIDSGLARVASHAPWSGLPSLKVAKVSRASAAQRAGRAGRTRDGRCLRLYTRHDHDLRPEFDVPEIRRSDLAEVVLGERELLLARRGVGGAGASQWSPGNGHSDVVAALEALDRSVEERFHADRLRVQGIDAVAASAADRARTQFVRAAKHLRRSEGAAGDPRAGWDDRLGMALLAGFPDRVARRLRDDELTLCGGGSARIAEQSEAAKAAFVVALDAEERADERGRGVRVRTASAIEPEWLLEMFPEHVTETLEARWVAQDERVDVTMVLRYRGLALDESRATPGPAADAVRAEALFAEATRRGVGAFVDDADELQRFLARLAFAASVAPKAQIPSDADALRSAALRRCCLGAASLDDLRKASLLGEIRAVLTPEQRRTLDEQAPDRVGIGAGRMVRVQYEPSKPPWIASRLQDFFGMRRAPSAGGVPMVVHLLAPNQRAVQVTSDLDGFWTKHYPAIRRELCRKYPRHPWPEDGRAASPPPPGPRFRG